MSSREPGEDTKMLVCDMCDKGYHTYCLQPAMDSIPTNGWRCKVRSIQIQILSSNWSSFSFYQCNVVELMTVVLL